VGKLKVMADLYSPNQDPAAGGADYGYRTDRPVQADIPAQPGNRGRRNGGLAAGILAFLAFIFGKLSYIGLLLLKFKGLWFTVVSTGLTALIYAQLFGWAFGVGIVLLILIHESGHVVVARIIGLPVSLPVMIPFLGAFVSMKQRPRTVAQESIMAIGGPVLGSIAAGLCYLGYLAMPDSSTGQLLRALAYFGFLINLFNLLPVIPLDGGRITAALHPALWLLGFGALLALVIYQPNPLLIVILLLAGSELWHRWQGRRVPQMQDYYRVRPHQRLIVGLLYFGLAGALVLGMHATHVPHSF